MSPLCCRSWRITENFWYFCGLPRDHAGNCSCDGKERPPEAIWYEDDLEAHEFIRKQREAQAKEDARKGRT